MWSHVTNKRIASTTKIYLQNSLWHTCIIYTCLCTYSWYCMVSYSQAITPTHVIFSSCSGSCYTKYTCIFIQGDILCHRHSLTRMLPSNCYFCVCIISHSRPSHPAWTILRSLAKVTCLLQFPDTVLEDQSKLIYMHLCCAVLVLGVGQLSLGGRRSGTARYRSPAQTTRLL